MQVIVCKNYDEMSAIAAATIAKVINHNPHAVLGLATGSTPEGTYDRLVAMNQNGEIDFSRITTVNLDEYYPISPENEQSYRYFMNKHLFDRVNIKKENTHLPSGSASDADAEAARYETFVRSLGGVDIQLLGIGRNGHIAFNEPGEVLYPATHITPLTADTIHANARFFKNEEEVPRFALTMGMGTILSARKIVLLASGKEKQQAVSRLLEGSVCCDCPATFLRLHGDVTLICDKDAVGEAKS